MACRVKGRIFPPMSTFGVSLISWFPSPELTVCGCGKVGVWTGVWWVRRKHDCKEEMQVGPRGVVLFFCFGVVFEEMADDVCFETFVARAVSLGVCMPQCEKKRGTGVAALCG